MKAPQLLYSGTITLALLAAAWMAGCASPRDPPPAELSPQPLAALRQSRPPAAGSGQPKVALVLGGGGLRGFAHLGALHALEEAGIAPDIVVGTSVGALVGAAYASGLSPRQIESIARGVKLSSLIDLTFSTRGLMRGHNIARWMDEITAGVPIANFPRRFAAVATDLRSGQAMLLDQGTAGAAVQASAAVPGVNLPVAYPGGHLVDGGIASLVPVRFARAMGADLVIAVDVYCSGPGGDGLAAPSVLLRAIRAQSCLMAAAELAEADIAISPPISVSGMSAKDEQERAIQIGYEATMAALPRARALIKAAGP
ncbi:patatin-like phospholipase family protein [Roseateles sp.]|uniref:patatin-like phospholipase family protein n=1 Tax=Roseateles sp. TaxID=1971397 RepID=UPI0025DD6D15|nr:patatin-like phospholipase family protein [Roseateles sp.]MBV8035581.1 patatin-like phospholipase family protein [Roseateles sp.]